MGLRYEDVACTDAICRSGSISGVQGWLVLSHAHPRMALQLKLCVRFWLPMQGDAVEIYIMTKEGTKKEVMPLKKD